MQVILDLPAAHDRALSVRLPDQRLSARSEPNWPKRRQSQLRRASLAELALRGIELAILSAPRMPGIVDYYVRTQLYSTVPRQPKR
jgi:hypothetical protein